MDSDGPMDISNDPTVSHVKRKLPTGDASEIALKRRKEFQEFNQNENLLIGEEFFDLVELNETPKTDNEIFMQTNSSDKLLEIPQVIDVNKYMDSLINTRPYDLTTLGNDNDLDGSVPWYDYRNGKTAALNGDDDGDVDSEDSNDECNWRNEYPDEDEKFEDRYDYFCQDYPSDEEDFITSKFEQFETNDDDD